MLNSAVSSPDREHLLKKSVLLTPHSKAAPLCHPHRQLTYFPKETTNSSWFGKAECPPGAAIGREIRQISRKNLASMQRWNRPMRWNGGKKRRGVGSLSRGQAPVITTASSTIPHRSFFSLARSNGAVDYWSPAPSPLPSHSDWESQQQAYIISATRFLHNSCLYP